MSNRLFGPLADPSADAGYTDHPARKGFFTDTSICIGCKACEVACKEWNAIPADDMTFSGMSYDNSEHLDGTTWRHVAFVEQRLPTGDDVLGGLLDGAAPAQPSSLAAVGTAVDLGMPSVGTPQPEPGIRWLMASDVCKHCTHAACLDVCPTGALIRTEFGTVVVQDDVCNGCGYCVPACPYGVIGKRETDGGAHKCTLCYDRLTDGLEPACAKACPTKSIQFGDVEELRARAAARVQELHAAGETRARLYGHDPDDGVGGDGAFFLLLDEPEVYGLPPDPVVTTRDLPSMWRHAAAAAATVALSVAAAFWGRRR